MKKFKHEERFLDSLTEQYTEMFSVVELSDGHELTPELLFTKKKFLEYFLDSIQYSTGTSYLDSIFSFDEDIYIYLSKTEPIVSSFSCRIYYPIRKKKEVDFFILNLKKLKKDGN